MIDSTAAADDTERDTIDPETIPLEKIGRDAMRAAGKGTNEAGRAQTTRAIIADIRAIVQHEPTVADLSDELCALLVMRWRRKVPDRKRRETRRRWLELTAAECAARGWIKPIKVPRLHRRTRFYGAPEFDGDSRLPLDRGRTLEPGPAENDPEKIPLEPIARQAGRAAHPGKHTAASEGGRAVQVSAIIVDIQRIVRHEPVVADLSEELVAMLVSRWHRTIHVRKQREARRRLLDITVQECVSRGWINPIRVPSIAPRTKCYGDPERTRRAIPMPQAQAPASPEELADRSHLPLLDLLAKYYIPERLIGKSVQTERLYEISIRNYSKWLGRPAVLGDLNRSTMLDFLRYLTQETKLAPATIAKDRTQLIVLWNFAARRGWLSAYPEIPTLSCPQRIPDAWSRAEMQALLEACGRQQGFIGRIPAAFYWTGLLLVVNDTAERIGALLQLRWEHVAADGWLTSPYEGRKGRTRDKRFKLRPTTMEVLEKIREYRERKVFHWPYGHSYIWHKWGKVLEAAGLPSNRRTKFHKIRRTTASEFEAAGGNATELLDHESRQTTLRYIDPRVRREVMPCDIVPGIGEELIERPATAIDDDVLAQVRKLLGV